MFDISVDVNLRGPALGLGKLNNTLTVCVCVCVHRGVILLQLFQMNLLESSHKQLKAPGGCSSGPEGRESSLDLCAFSFCSWEGLDTSHLLSPPGAETG